MASMSPKSNILPFYSEGQDAGFVITSKQFLLEYFEKHQLNTLIVSSVPELRKGQVFKISLRDMLSLDSDAIQVIDRAFISKELDIISSCIYDRCIGLAILEGKDIGMVFSDNISYLAYIQRSRYMNYLLPDDLEEIKAIKDNEAYFLNLSNLISPSQSLLQVVRPNALDYYPLPSATQAVLTNPSSVSNLNLVEVMGGKYYLNISLRKKIDPSDNDDNQSQASSKVVRFTDDEAVSNPIVTQITSIRMPQKNFLPDSSEIQRGFFQAANSLTTGRPPLQRKPTTNIQQMHVVQQQKLPKRNKRALSLLVEDSPFTTPESTMDLTPSDSASTMFTSSTESIQQNSLQQKVKSPRFKQAQQMILSKPSNKLPLVVARPVPSIDPPGTKKSNSPPPIIIGPASEYEDPEILSLLFSDPFKSIKFSQIFKFLRSYGWTYSYGNICTTYYRPHCKNTACKSNLVVNQDFFVDEKEAKKWLLNEFHTHHEDKIRDFNIKNNIVVSPPGSQSYVVTSNSQKQKTPLKSPSISSQTGKSAGLSLSTTPKSSETTQITPPQSSEDYFAASTKPSGNSSVSTAAITKASNSSQSQSSSIIGPATEFEDPIIIQLLFGQNDRPVSFQKVFTYLRSYNWQYRYGSLQSVYFRPHCQTTDIKELTHGVDFFRGEEEVLSWLKEEFTTNYKEKIAAVLDDGQEQLNLPAFERRRRLVVKKKRASTSGSDASLLSYNLSDDLESEPSEESGSTMSQDFEGKRRTKQRQPGRKRCNSSQEDFDSIVEIGMPVASNAAKNKKRKRTMSCPLNRLPANSSLMTRPSVIGIDTNTTLGNHLLPYSNNLDEYMNTMINKIDDDSFHNRYLPFPLPGRTDESIAIFTSIMQSLRSGHGKVIYLTGFPGGGKTQSTVVILNYIKSLLEQFSLPTYLDYLLRNKKFFASQYSNSRGLTGSPSHCTQSDSEFSILSASQPTKSYMHYIRVNCVGLADIDHLYEMVNKEMSIVSEKIKNKKEIREVIDSVLLNTNTLPCTMPITNLEVSAGHELTEVDVCHKKLQFIPMLILVLDELDYLKTQKSNIYQAIMKWTKGSVIVIGSGNIIHSAISSSSSESSNTTLVFKAYEVPELCNILQYRTGSLLSKPAQQLLATKVKERYNGDVRRLLGWAKSAMHNALNMYRRKNTHDPQSADGFVTPVHIISTETQSFETEQRKSLLVLTPQLRTLLVALIINHCIKEAFNIKQAYSYYNTYLSQYNLGQESLDTIKTDVSCLQDYAMITRINPQSNGDKALFRVSLKEDELLSLDCSCLPEVQKSDIKRYVNHQKHLAELAPENA